MGEREDRGLDMETSSASGGQNIKVALRTSSDA
jgi:hypothetical protein